MNSASLDVFCQQFENYEQTFALLFPREFLKYRYADFLFECGVSNYKRVPDEPWEYLVSADWYDEIGECEIAELIRLCASDWNMEPPSPELRQLSEQIRSGRLSHWRWTVRQTRDRILSAVDAVFEKLNA